MNDYDQREQETRYLQNKIEQLRISHAELGTELDACRQENQRLRELLERWRADAVGFGAFNAVLLADTTLVLDGET